MKGASISPRRPMKDDSPDAWVIMLVGNSSGVMKKTAPNVPDAPSITDTTDSVLRARIYQHFPNFHQHHLMFTDLRVLSNLYKIRPCYEIVYSTCTLYITQYVNHIFSFSVEEESAFLQPIHNLLTCSPS